MSPIDVTHEQLAALPPERLAAVQGLVAGWLAESRADAPISTDVAETVVNDWLLKVLPDRFVALKPHLIAGGDIWSVSVGVAYPEIGVIGEVGEVLVSTFSRGILSATQPEVMKSVGMGLYQERKDEIQAAFLSAGNA